MGATFTYRIEVVNLSGRPAHDAAVIISLPLDSLDVRSGPVGPSLCYGWRCELGTIAAHSSAVVTVRVRTTPGLLDGTNVSSPVHVADSTARAGSTTTPDPNFANNETIHRNKVIPRSRLICNSSGQRCRWVVNTYETGRLAPQVVDPPNSVSAACDAFGEGFGQAGVVGVAVALQACSSWSDVVFSAVLTAFKSRMLTAADLGRCYTIRANSDGSIPSVTWQALVVPIPTVFLGGNKRVGARGCERLTL